MSKDWKIYTKTGDAGETSLIGGTRVPKHHERIEAYGTIDELNSFVGLLRDQQIDAAYRNFLIKVQEHLFVIESLFAADKESVLETLPGISCDHVQMLEKAIDEMNEELPPLTNFILPGGHPAVSYSHVARTICRRAERVCLRISRQNEVDKLNLKYLNRLSDYFFVLARKLAQELNAVEIPWKPEY